ncbi:YitT family protein [Peribacillus psychrosaccharolyticus]|uniref:YitT family protein n=1 Tax=Peribacillus psychrosaccharolyticus TaxID=1407 RepID=A0A974S210_PERPY|nr:YitT family protein [Peribacillus psychrosaccharolyticus]MEC2054973.1 YitT family protein [Peribacillus psychrosaccharolyticus]MED3746526.1 YitT family protein [Peribacillus psychrosaccharolyticus]QQT02109.1 YitT family protein [Peribacillus psychrosaccharolyticus]
MYKVLAIVFGSIVVGVAYNMFLIPHKILSSGLSGIAIMLGIVTPLNTGILNFLLNLPLLILGVLKLGKQFISYTILSVVVLSISLYLIPIQAISTEPILSSLFGGVLTGVGIGIIFRASGSSGGFDIIAMLLQKKNDFPLGTLLSAMNAVVVVISGFVFGWDAALNTLVAIYATGKVIDTIHTNHIKLTLMIVTNKGDELKTKLLANLYRGITMMDGQGAYTGQERKILMTVITRYQLTEVKSLINEVDPDAFVNITETTEVVGMFHRG